MAKQFSQQRATQDKTHPVFGEAIARRLLAIVNPETLAEPPSCERFKVNGAIKSALTWEAQLNKRIASSSRGIGLTAYQRQDDLISVQIRSLALCAAGGGALGHVPRLRISAVP